MERMREEGSSFFFLLVFESCINRRRRYDPMKDGERKKRKRESS
jgi:hypothetical protein